MYSSGWLYSCITSIASRKSAVAKVKVAPTMRDRYWSVVRPKWYTNGYIKLKAKIHKTVTVLPSQSSGVVPLNDPFKTSVPAKYGQTTFRALHGLFCK